MKNPFSSVKQFQSKLNLSVELPKPKETWRLLGESECRNGEIHAINQIRGLAVATNGIIVALYNPFLESVDFGHWDFFVPDIEDMDEDGETSESELGRDLADSQPRQAKRTKKTMAILAEYV